MDIKKENTMQTDLSVLSKIQQADVPDNLAKKIEARLNALKTVQIAPRPMVISIAAAAIALLIFNAIILHSAMNARHVQADYSHISFIEQNDLYHE